MSFSDSSGNFSRPVLIGAILGFAMLVICLLFYAFVFDERLQGGKRVDVPTHTDHEDEKIGKLTERIERHKITLSQSSSRVLAADELVKLKDGNKRRAEVIVGLGDTITRSMADCDLILEAFDSYKNKYREAVRAKARGQTMDKLATQDGRVYENVTINRVTEVGLQIRHEGGLRRIPYEELPAEMQDYFQFDPDEKIRAIQREQESHLAHDMAAQKSVSSVNQPDKQGRGIDTAPRADREASLKQIAFLQSEANSIQEELRALREELNDQSNKTISQAPQIRRRIANRERQLVEIRSQLARLRSEL